MPYNLVTKDGIRLENIPDDVDPKDPRLKAAVEKRRADRFGQQVADAKKPSAEIEVPDPTQGMSETDKNWANLGAGMTNFGIGLAQVATKNNPVLSTLRRTPLKERIDAGLNEAFGGALSDEGINEKRQRDAQLAASQQGGKFMQMGGEALPSFAMPGGVISQASTKLPVIGSALAKAGVGSRAIPTLTAEGAGLGMAQGAMMPTTSEESRAGNMAMGGIGGAAIPGALGLAGLAARPIIPALGRRATANRLGDMMDVSPQAQAKLQQAMNQSNQRVVNAPETLSSLTQNPQIAMAEKAARANPEFTAQWADLDQNAANARWKALDDALGDQGSVDAAKAATDAFAQAEIPKVMTSMKPGRISTGIKDLLAASKTLLDGAEASRNGWDAVVFRKLREEIKASNRSPQALWNVRKMLREWQEGTPPPGMPDTRAPKGSRAIQESVKAIDEVLNRASSGKWTRFLDDFGHHAKKEAAQKAGQNIRNEFMDEILNVTKGGTTSARNPAATRAKLEAALKRHGKNEFGQVIDWPQENVVKQVLDDLQREEILGRVTKTMTGGGGSQTAPLAALMSKNLMGANASNWIEKIASVVGNYGRRRQQRLINEILKSPQDALFLMQQAQKIKRPLTTSEKRLIQAARAIVSTAPVSYIANQAAQ